MRRSSFVSLDGRPLGPESERILIQAGTRARPTGWVDHEATFMADGGQADHPWPADRLDRHDAMGRHEDESHDQVGNPPAEEGVPLDVKGNPRGTSAVKATGGELELELPRDALYIVLSGPITRCPFLIPSE